ncbi:unnamed protein product [Allacma fusca]|uniref:Phenoloxidase-activating factor 2 n=1 Tax=Allacma fusca TaxID=39272 RepID=A0A8J2PUD4_9HEXA|nr:unnamed protein product [Allacma fusca]
MYKALILLVCVAVSIDARGLKLSGPGRHDPAIPNVFFKDTKIVGGQVATQGQFPHQVALYERFIIKYFTCGASLISPKWVLTAGHCVVGVSASSLSLRVGEQSLNRDSGIEQELSAKRIILHEGYDDDLLYNDIALIEIDGEFNLNDNVKPIELAPAGEEYDGGNCVTSGWGSTREGGSVSDDLRYVQVPFVSDEACRDAYSEDEVLSSMLCAGVAGKDACQGDSGGPILCDGGSSSGTLSGIVSWGYGCARAGSPGVYTQVSQFRDWIKTNSGL